MARFELLDYIDLGTQGYHDATSWKVTKDSLGLDIIDQSLNDKVNLIIWNTSLPDGNGGFYGDLNSVYLWIKVHILGSVSNWFRVGPANQNNQMFRITENGKQLRVVNSITAGIK